MDKSISKADRKTFEISSRKNEYTSFKNYISNLQQEETALIGFNNLNYDYPIIHDLLTNNFNNLTSNQLNDKIYNHSKKIIETQNLLDKYSYITIPEWKHVIKQIDLYKIWHFDNKAKRCGLKWIQYMMDWPNLEDLPFNPHNILDELYFDKVIRYCMNDVDSTEQLFNLTRGITNNVALNDYKGKDKIQLREDIGKSIGFNITNFNDVKIGERLVKSDYARTNNIKINDLKPQYHPIDFTFGDCFPENYKFTTPHFNKFIDSIKNVKVNINDDKQEFEFKVNQTTYIIARGGIHSQDGPRLITPTKNQILRDADVGLILWPK